VKRLRPLLLAVVAVAAVVVLFGVLRPENDSDGTATDTVETRSTTQATTTSPTTTTASTTTAPKPPARTRIPITVRGGRVIGEIRRVTVARGARVELFVTADVADEVHLHGYDISRDVAPGAPARLLFRATTSGRFEVELEQRKLQIAEITVRP
jgi:heme/copper-type cytochrome/quinol oxidase subunit 2